LRPDPYFSATKLEWLLRKPEIAFVARNGRLLAGTIDTWLIWKLTGGRVHATDPTNASRTLLFDINRLKWSRELCDIFKIPMEVLPEVRPSAGDFGKTVTSFFGKSIPITGVAGDQQAALFGQGCYMRPGEEHVAPVRFSFSTPEIRFRALARIAGDGRVR
jgi:glycerol kinase